ncbi:MAG: chromo domain-containing protein [Sphingomonadales bacterium]|nr:chromo domain-containing protein [Sphingomonadales bacterium]
MSKIHSDIKPFQYELQDLLKVPLKRRFYREELTKTEAPKDSDYFQVEKILKERQIKGKKEYFIKFLYYPSKFSLWIPEENLIKNGTQLGLTMNVTHLQISDQILMIVCQ